MADLEDLIHAVDKLSVDELMQLYRHIMDTRVRFLDTPTQEPGAKRAERVLGLHAGRGEFWMSEDFDAELPDSFWLGGE